MNVYVTGFILNTKNILSLTKLKDKFLNLVSFLLLLYNSISPPFCVLSR